MSKAKKKELKPEMKEVPEPQPPHPPPSEPQAPLNPSNKAPYDPKPMKILADHMAIQPDQVIVLSVKNGDIRLDIGINNPVNGLFYQRLISKHIDKLFDEVEGAARSAGQNQNA